MRRAITAFFRMCLRIFFRRIELLGLENIPRDGAVIFAVNHPNGLVDPLFVVCFAPVPVSFLAKAPLFGYPVIGWFVKAFDAIPVYRKQDNTKGTNAETFARAREVLQHGGSIAIFPEGTTHDDPQLRELKTGAARIALGANVQELKVIPTGIYYTRKHTFRSSALAIFGEPLHVQPVGTGAESGEGRAETVDGDLLRSPLSAPRSQEPPAPDVEDLTAAIEAGLRAVTLQADSHAALKLIGKAEDIFTADDEQPLAQEFDLRRRFIDGYHYLRMSDPQRLERLQSQIAQFEAELSRAKLDVDDLRPHIGAARLFRVLVLLPLAIAAAIVHYPTYRLVGFLAKRLAKGELNVLATMKFLAALALYPLTYIAIAFFLGWWTLILPFLGYIALYTFEEIDDVIGDLRAIGHRLFRRYGYARLVAQREAIRNEMIEVAREMA